MSVEYGPARVFECPPNGQGIAAHEALGIVRGMGLHELEPESPVAMHRMIEAMRLAFADARALVRDPFGPISDAECALWGKEGGGDGGRGGGDEEERMAMYGTLLEEGYLERRRSLIDDARAAADVRNGRPLAGSDTVSLQVVDAEGNAAAFINSNYAGFGTPFIPSGCGFTLQNRGANFSLHAESPNALGPRKRPFHTIIPALATWNDERAGMEAQPGEGAFAGRLLASFSNMGGFMQPQGHLQLVVRLVDWGYDPQTAVDAPRFCLPDGDPADPTVLLEDGTHPDTVQALRDRGHAVRVVTGWERSTFGRAQAILRAPNAVRWAGSDGRGDGAAQALMI
jgi:gamma-glutamyltranspeptidase/glutathione hydrolase